MNFKEKDASYSYVQHTEHVSTFQYFAVMQYHKR